MIDAVVDIVVGRLQLFGHTVKVCNSCNAVKTRESVQALPPRDHTCTERCDVIDVTDESAD